MGHAFSLSGPENMYAECNSFLNCRRADLHSSKLATNREAVFKSEQSLFFWVAKYCPMAKKLKSCYKVVVYVNLDRYIRLKLKYFTPLLAALPIPCVTSIMRVGTPVITVDPLK